MNSTEQKHHRTVTDGLAARLTIVEEVLTALDQRVSDLAKAARAEIAAVRTATDDRTRTLVGEERTHRLDLANEQRAYVDREDRTLRESIARLQVRTGILAESTVWQRLWWLVRG